MTAYTDALAAGQAAPTQLLHFTGPNKKFYSRDWSGRTSTADPGLMMKGSIDVDVDPLTAAMKVGNREAEIIDRDGAVTSWLETNDKALANTKVDVYDGFTTIGEASFATRPYFVNDYEAVPADVGVGSFAAYRFQLTDIFGLMDKSLFETLDQPDFELNANLTAASTTITLTADPTGVWPASGYVMLYDRDKQALEVIAYSAITPGVPATLTGLTRRVQGTGFVAKTWDAQYVRVSLCHIMRGNPLDLMRNLLLTTAGGGNGAFDLANGNGLGSLIPDALVNHTDINAKRDAYGATADGFDWLFIFTRPIDNVKDFIEANCLLAGGFWPTLDANNLLTVVPFYQSPVVATALAGAYNPERDPKWKRNWQKRENNFAYSMDYHPGERKFKRTYPFTQAASQTAFKASKLRTLESLGARGAAGVQYGLPDLGGDRVAQRVSQFYALEFANPNPTFELECHWSEKDRIVGSGVYLDHDTLRQLGKSTLGTTAGLFLITGKSIEADAQGGAKVILSLRQRVPIFRPFFVNSDTAAATYGAATAAERERGYITPDSGTFSDGTEGYKFITGKSGVLPAAIPQPDRDIDQDSPGFFDEFQGRYRQRDLAAANEGVDWEAQGSTSSASFVTVFSEEFYIPKKANQVIFYGQVWADGTNLGTARFLVGGLASNSVSGTVLEINTKVTWTVDVSSLSGTRQLFEGQIRRDTVDPGGANVRVEGFAFARAQES